MQTTNGGVGTELREIIKEKKIFIEKKGCGCAGFAQDLDRIGIEGVEENFFFIVDRLEFQFRKRYLMWLPFRVRYKLSTMFVRPHAKRMVRRAIDQAREKRDAISQLPRSDQRDTVSSDA